VIGSAGGGMMGRAAPRRLCQLKSILVTLSPSSPMLDGSSRPALPFSSMVRPSTNFQRRSSTGIGPVHEAQIYDRLPWGGGMMAQPDKRAFEAQSCERKFCELRKRLDVARDRTAQVVAAEIEHLECRRERLEQRQRLAERRPCARKWFVKFVAVFGAHPDTHTHTHRRCRTRTSADF
jgi:hypothetical protein